MNLFGKIIATEGIDLAGKTTQSKLFVNYLNDNHIKAKYVKLPSKYNYLTYRLIYGMLNNGTALKYPYVFHSLQFINKYLFQLFVLPFLLLTNDILVFDRWALSAYVYGEATGINKKFNSFLYNRMIKPWFTFFLMRDPIEDSRAHDAYDSDGGLQKRVKKSYINFMNTHVHEYFSIIDATKTIEEVHAEIVEKYHNISQQLL